MVQRSLAPRAFLSRGLQATAQGREAFTLGQRLSLISRLFYTVLMVQKGLTKQRALLVAIGLASEPLLDDALLVVVVYGLRCHLVIQLVPARTLAALHVRWKVQAFYTHGAHERRRW